LQAARQYTLQPFGEERDAEEIFRVCVVLRRVPSIDREQIGGKFSLIESVGEHVRVRQCHFDPGLQWFERGLANRNVELRRWRRLRHRGGCGDRPRLSLSI
jgi:hypothetical protein